MLQQGQQFPLTIKRLGINGEGVGYFKKQVVFVPGALPGEEVVVQATNIYPTYAEGKIVRIRKRSPHRVKPLCPVYDRCGGCQLQHLDYNAQLEAKRDIVIQALERHSRLNIEALDIRPTIGMDDPWHYRNKSQFQTGVKKGRVIAGLYSMNSHELIDIDRCFIQHDATNRVTTVVKTILQDLRIPIYHERKKTGVVRTIVARVGFYTGDVQLVIVTATKELPRKELFVAEVKRRLPEVKSIAQNINGQKTSLIFGDETIVLAGEPYIQEVLGDLSFELSARAFFQLNPIQTVKLYDEVKKAASLTKNERVVDAYCGVGTIGLWLAREAKEVRGMDTIPEAIDDARQNAERHGFTNVTYAVGRAEVLLPKWVKEGWKPDVIVVDPPRTGCDNALLKTILQVKPKTVVYVSCNPSSLARDIGTLAKQYRVEYIQPFDLFPHTAHVESVAKLVRK
ncbi:RNA methyltransferase [Anoxybacillus gonensis]|uniref:23S rRNA (Uracil(1939)-C(5))-methyltransferase RlmD n=1 Tax=Anoxybacillus gonensis TaxID=198467 RepID=A0AAW7TK22_9BACL|nr:23S rRNA (uracil(1939)-C(5))-methyltransferase RlmD [Anoxybacillus gonensis]AKS37322.1 RNA methyltransferase [Anoxybacillus gonensis]KGP62000.1 RNA methyltransferase [Anoxybacillus gonensis]MCX8045875.1 23S rRNA (uracil(1939)-C(5))-methyltransferase RlmD [Anoxybacillus gonensis]MDO0878211.1 23S rRNA (uracil(1939)-C(5))-methyltransferase RlmD [Anoxybacillus gonensis]